MSTIIDIEPGTDAADLIALCTKASHVDIRAGNDHLTRPIFSTLRGLVFDGRRYNDKVAACTCSKMTVYKFADYGYTKCERHGFLSIGLLRREIKK